MAVAEIADYVWAQGPYRTIVVDPPWPFADRGSRIAAAYEYMTDLEILEIPVRRLGTRKSHVYLWATDTHLPLALACLDRWGYELKSQIVWCKTTKAGAPHIGAGHYTRKAHEVCLLGVRGGLVVKPARRQPSWFQAPRGRHSAKPERLQDIAEIQSPANKHGLRLELFARRHRPGWVCWGNETEETICQVEQFA